MKFSKDIAKLYIPDGLPEEPALRRTTHLAIMAHPDDIEFFAIDGILNCYNSSDQWFGGVNCVTASTIERIGRYAELSEAQMLELRIKEQEAAARLGQYSFVAQLGWSRQELARTEDKRIEEDLRQLISASRPEVIYTHNPADKHLSHLSVFFATLATLRCIEPSMRPKRFYGVEGWRDLDWLNDEEKIRFNLSGESGLFERLSGVYESQITGGKRYDRAIAARWLANATLFDAYHPDAENKVSVAINLTPLIEDDSIDPIHYISGAIDRFRDRVVKTLTELARK